MAQKIPWIAFGNETLRKLPKVEAGDKIRCPHCGGEHELIPARDEQGRPMNKLLYYRCGGKIYVGAISGRCIAGVKPDFSGRLEP